jgi:peptide/nickel transport system substrate-binding protein
LGACARYESSRLPWLDIGVAGLCSFLAFSLFVSRPSHANPTPREELLQTSSNVGTSGGRLVIALRSEPKTLNPVLAGDTVSRDVLASMHSDLIHINRGTLKSEPALAKSWKVSPDGKVFEVKLRTGLHFSDGQPFDADDVVFSFRVYQDEKTHSPQRDLLTINGKSIDVQKVDASTVRFTLPDTYASGERLFDSIAMLPRHKLEKAFADGTLSKQWGLGASASDMSGMGAFRLKEYVPGQKIVLERNPFYWKEDKAGTRLPYASEVDYLFVGNEDAQVLRFQSGDTDLLSPMSASSYSILKNSASPQNFCLNDLGAGMEFNFLDFNLNDVSKKNLPDVARKQGWFQDVRFRQAVSYAVDRDALVRLVYGGRATPLWSHVTPANKPWLDGNLPHPARSLDQARQILKAAGYSWDSNGALKDPKGSPVTFTIAVSASSQPRTKIATLVQQDLTQLGMDVQVVPLEFRALLDRVFNTSDYDAAVLALTSGDADPTSEMNIWLSSGATHVWHLNETSPATSWEAEIDRLMNQQMTTLAYAKRKKLFDRVQEIEQQNLPFVSLVSPNILFAAKRNIGNVAPAVIEPYSLAGLDVMYFNEKGGQSCQ